MGSSKTLHFGMRATSGRKHKLRARGVGDKLELERTEDRRVAAVRGEQQLAASEAAGTMVHVDGPKRMWPSVNAMNIVGASSGVG